MSVFDAADSIALSIQEVFDLSLRVLKGAGLSDAHARAVARVITAGERDECASHGLYRLPGCVMTIRSGKLSPDAEPGIVDASPALVRADARFGYSLLAFERAAPLLVEKAKAVGVAALAITNCFHFSALWPEIEHLTEQGVAALAMTPSHAWVAPAGGRKGLLGTNPLAFGWPRPGPHPYVFDFATSAIARGDLALHEIAGQPIPEGWGVDAEGRPTTDARAALDGAMLTFGGHKGSALSTMIELLAGPLIGDMTSRESMAFDAGAQAAPCHGELILAFDPAMLGGPDPAANAARAEALFAAFADQGARLPSERRYAARARSLARGVRTPRPLYERILALGF
ncbi:Ldh family oxidoreductase [Sandaracinobacter sp. RS1-74]|uniref:Ldh family oxidoreductase n=1 Tax=Sandaracinobacteroides sayramensis TaxID=2913411 RepID=UPI001ED9F5D0|nr:Ldh family oxidoreductase [Sandaracinobacteroides sayramensis]MCG2840140.1 Ldh family oxidoreductase [Sandaracinobacteroides sayramensis]